MQLTDLLELKTFLDLDPSDTTEDKKLLLMVDQATSWIEDYLDRQLKYQQRTEYYDGKGTRKLPLKSRPVFCDTDRTITVTIDHNGGYGQIPNSFNGNSLTYGTDYYLMMDGETNNSSRSGILVRNNALWPKPSARANPLLTPFLVTNYGCIKVVYWAGYTYDTMPNQLRVACNTIVARMRFVWPVGFELSSDSYAEKSVSILAERKGYIMGGDMVKGMLNSFRNWTFGV